MQVAREVIIGLWKLEGSYRGLADQCRELATALEGLEASGEHAKEREAILAKAGSLLSESARAALAGGGAARPVPARSRKTDKERLAPFIAQLDNQDR